MNAGWSFNSNRVWGGVGRFFNKRTALDTQFDGGQSCPNYVAFILRHDFGYLAKRPERRVRFLPQ
jgi:hypothetical protein